MSEEEDERNYPNGRSFLKGVRCSICEQVMYRHSTKELVRIRGFKFYKDALKELGTPVANRRLTWCTQCTVKYFEWVVARRAEVLAEREGTGQASVPQGDATDGSAVGSREADTELSEVRPSDSIGDREEVSDPEW